MVYSGIRHASERTPLTQQYRSSQLAKRVLELKNEGNKCFAKKEYTKAVEQYDAAIKLLPDGGDKADLLCNKAACFYQTKRCAYVWLVCMSRRWRRRGRMHADGRHGDSWWWWEPPTMPGFEGACAPMGVPQIDAWA